jgi:hypothetical protein
VSGEEFELDSSENVEALAEKLKELFEKVDPPPTPKRFYPSPHVAAAGLIGISIEQAAATLQRQYLVRVSSDFRIKRETDPAFDPADWNIIVPPYLFVGWEKIDGVQVIHSEMCPEWSVLLCRSSEYMTNQLLKEPLPHPSPTTANLRDDLMDLYDALMKRPVPPVDPHAVVRVIGEA